MHDGSVVFSRQQARQFDQWAMQVVGIPGLVLMENAGRSAAEYIASNLAPNGPVLILCGTGNNGGDGFVIARHLVNHGIQVKVGLCGRPEKVQQDAKVNLEILKRMGQQVNVVDLDTAAILAVVEGLARDCALLVDAILGTGLAGDVKEPIATLIQAVNRLSMPVVAVDVPSGLDCDTGLPLGVAVKARWTITFAANKKGFLSEHARPYTGQVIVADIGITPMAWPSLT